MLYYQFHLPEQSAKAERFGLSSLDEGVWAKLTRVYVYSECPLPLEESQLLKIIHGRTKKERESLSRILSFFFRRTEAGYVNDDLDKNIKEAKTKQGRSQKANDTKYGRNREEEDTQSGYEDFNGENEKNTEDNIRSSLNSEKTNIRSSLNGVLGAPNSKQITENNIKPQKRCTYVHPKNAPLHDEIALSEKTPQKTSGKKIPLPDDFHVTEELRNWYETRMLTESTWKPEDLPNHFDGYVAYCKSNDKRYVDHYSALRNYVMGDWGGVRKQRIAEERNKMRDFRYRSTKEIFSELEKTEEKKLRGEVYEHEGAVDKASNGTFIRPFRDNLSSEVDGGFWG